MNQAVLETVRSELRRKLVDLRGTDAFAGALAERERALGLHDKAAETPAETPAETSAAAETTPAPEPVIDTPVADIADMPAPQYDPWGNEILDTPGRFGQYRVRGIWPARIVRVCGEAASSKHLFAWAYDANERRFVCAVCWPGTPTTAKRSAS